MKLTKFPMQTETADPVETLMPGLAEIRNLALTQGDMESAVLLSHVHAWLYWIKENWETLESIAREK